MVVGKVLMGAAKQLASEAMMRTPKLAPKKRKLSEPEALAQLETPEKLEAPAQTAALDVEIAELEALLARKRAERGGKQRRLAFELDGDLELVELEFRDPRRAEVGALVHRLINVDEACFERFAPDFKWAFEEGPEYRVIAAYRGGELLGGAAFWMLRRGIYVEFLGTRYSSRAGVPILEWLKDQVRSTGRKFISLNAIMPGHYDQRSIHAYAWYVSRGFAPISDPSVLQVLTGMVCPKMRTPLTEKKAYTSLRIPQASEGTTCMVWLGCPQRPQIDTQM